MKFFLDISKFIFEHGIRSLSGLITTILLINYFSPSEYGNLSIALTILGVLTAFSSLGFDAVLLRKFIEAKNKLLLYESIFLRFIAASIIFILISIAAFSLDIKWLYILNILLIIIFFESFNAVRELSFSEEKYNLIVIANSLGSLAQILSIIILIKFEMSIYFFAIPFVLNRVIFILFLSYFQINYLKHIPFKTLSVNKELLSAGMPLMMASITGLIYAAQDQWMISLYLSKADVGIYAAGIKFVLICLVLPTIVTNVLYHNIIKQKNEDFFKRYLQGLYSALLFSGILLAIFFNIFSENIIRFLYPSVYIDSAEIMSIYSLVLITAFFQSLNNKLLILFDLQHFIFKRMLIALCINLALNIFLIPKYGIVGAAYATVISELFVILSYSLNSKTMDIFILQIKSFNLLNIFLIRSAR